MMKQSPDFDLATFLAYEELFQTNCRAFPLRPQDMRFQGIIHLPMREYSKRTGIPVEALKQGGEFADGFTYKKSPHGDRIILYDDQIFQPHDHHTLLHEVGHVRLGHTGQTPIEEIEAHFFASQMLAPNVILYDVLRRGYRITVDLQITAFHLSRTAATKNLDYMDHHKTPHPNPNDALVLSLFRDYLDRYFPDKHIVRDSFDEDRFYDALLNQWNK